MTIGTAASATGTWSSLQLASAIGVGSWWMNARPNWLGISDLPDEPCKRKQTVEDEQAENMKALLGDELWEALSEAVQDNEIQ